MRLKCNKPCCWIHERARRLSEGHSPGSDSAMSYSESPNIKLEAGMSQLGLSEECPSVEEWNSQCQQAHQAQGQGMRDGGSRGVRGGAARDCEGENDCDCADCTASSPHGGGSPAYPWSYPPNQSFGPPYGGWYDGSANPPYGGADWNNPNNMGGYAGPTPGMDWTGGYGPGAMPASAMRPPDMPNNGNSPWNLSPPAGPDGFSAQGSFGQNPAHFMGKPGSFKDATVDSHRSDDDSEDEPTMSWPIIPRLLTRYRRLKGKLEKASGPKKAKLQQKMQLLARKLAVAQRQYSYRPAPTRAPFPPPMMLGYPGYWGQPPANMMMMMYGAPYGPPYGPPVGYPTVSPVRAKFLRRIAVLRSKGLLFNFKYWKDWWMRNFGPAKRADGTYNWRAWRKFWSSHFSGGASENADSRPPLASAAPSMAASPAASDATMKDLQNDQHVGSPQEGKAKDPASEGDVDDASSFTPPWFQMMGQAGSQAGSSTAAGPPWSDPQMVDTGPSAVFPSDPVPDIPADDEQPLLTEFVTTVKQSADKWNKVKEQFSREENVRASKCDHCGHSNPK